MLNCAFRNQTHVHQSRRHKVKLYSCFNFLMLKQPTRNCQNWLCKYFIFLMPWLKKKKKRQTEKNKHSPLQYQRKTFKTRQCNPQVLFKNGDLFYLHEFQSLLFPTPSDRYAMNKSLRSSSGWLLQPCGRPPTQPGHEVAGPASASVSACPHGLQVAVSFCEGSGSLPLNSIEIVREPTVTSNVLVQCTRNTPCCSKELSRSGPQPKFSQTKLVYQAEQ